MYINTTIQALPAATGIKAIHDPKQNRASAENEWLRPFLKKENNSNRVCILTSPLAWSSNSGGTFVFNQHIRHLITFLTSHHFSSLPSLFPLDGFSYISGSTNVTCGLKMFPVLMEIRMLWNPAENASDFTKVSRSVYIGLHLAILASSRL